VIGHDPSVPSDLSAPAPAEAPHERRRRAEAVHTAVKRLPASPSRWPGGNDRPYATSTGPVHRRHRGSQAVRPDVTGSEFDALQIRFEELGGLGVDFIEQDPQSVFGHTSGEARATVMSRPWTTSCPSAASTVPTGGFQNRRCPRAMTTNMGRLAPWTLL
jgi:hypothetical protein